MYTTGIFIRDEPVGTGVFSELLQLSLANIILSFFHIHFEVYDSPEQAAHYHIPNTYTLVLHF
jgi:hypothetical protein